MTGAVNGRPAAPAARRRSAALVAAAVLAGGSCSASTEPAPPLDCTFTNPVAWGQDPWVVRHEDAYYTVESRSGGIYVYRSAELTDPKRNEVRVWTAPANAWNSTNVWAPELHRIDGRWYIYYAAGSAGPPYIHQRSGVLASVGDDPQGEYVDRGMLYTGDDVQSGTDPVWAIDLTVHRLDGQLYAAWSGWEEAATTDRTPQHLYIARMSDPVTIASDRVRISSPTEPWERGTELDLNEGPEFLVHDADVFLIYSARESWLPSYRLGQLRLSPGGDPMDPDAWTKTGPVFEPTAGVPGVGHASFTVSPDGSEDWMVYHAKTTTAPGWERVIRTQPFGWEVDGSPDFGEPVPSGEPIPQPAGQCAGGP